MQLFARAGFNIYVGSRSYYPTIDDPEIECTLIRAQEMARYVAGEAVDAGLTGIDWIEEHRAATGEEVVSVTDLVYSKQSFRKVRWVLAAARGVAIPVAAGSGRRTDLDRAGARDRGVLRAARRQRRRRVLVGRHRGEAADLADAIVEATETGSTLRANHLRIIDTVIESNPQLIANRRALDDAAKRTKIENVALLLKAAMEAQGRVGLMLNVKRDDIDTVLALLPALQRPTVSPLSDAGWVAVSTVLEERAVRELIPRLRAAGGHGIVEYPLNKIVL